MRRTDVPFSGLEIENRQAAPVVVYLTDPASDERVLGVVVRPGRTAQASVPVGNYGLYFLKGASWCNEDVGFRDGSRAVVRGGVEIRAGETRVLMLAAAASGRPEGVYFSARTPQAVEPPPPAVQGDGFVELAQRPDGHYYIDGYVNGAPIAFVVDTGATFTTLSREDAYRVGIEVCTSRTFHTANGVVEGCVGRAPKIQIGGFILRDTDVAVLPNQAGAALLGMNILNNFRIEQQGGVMRISASGV
jgi:clan AA aspartic protease (TIGR02281 family)